MAFYTRRRVLIVCFIASTMLVFLSLHSKLISPSQETKAHEHGFLSGTESRNVEESRLRSVNSESQQSVAVLQARPVRATYSDLENYLKPINTLYNVVDSSKEPSQNKKALEFLLRTGQSLQPYTTERGETAWIENGIVYRPWRRPDPSTVNKKNPDPYFTEYEAYMPFNETLFFEGQNPDPKYKSEKKIILWHTPTRYTAPKSGLEPMKLCPEFPCQITTNRQYMHKSSAAIFTGKI